MSAPVPDSCPRCGGIANWIKKAVLAATVLLVGAAQPAIAQTQNSMRSSESTFHDDGHALREQIVALFNKLRSSGASFGRGNGPGIDVNDVVSRYIKVGMPIEEAREVLIAAGCGASALPPRPSRSDPVADINRFNLLAGFTLESAFFARYEFSVIVRPDVKGSPSARVGSLNARILYSAL